MRTASRVPKGAGHRLLPAALLLQGSLPLPPVVLQLRLTRIFLSPEEKSIVWLSHGGSCLMARAAVFHARYIVPQLHEKASRIRELPSVRMGESDT